MRYSRQQCRYCGAMISRNALGRAAHQRSLRCEWGQWLRDHRHDRDRQIARAVGRFVAAVLDKPFIHPTIDDVPRTR